VRFLSSDRALRALFARVIRVLVEASVGADDVVRVAFFRTIASLSRLEAIVLISS